MPTPTHAATIDQKPSESQGVRMFGPARRVPVRAVDHRGPAPGALGPADEDKEYRLDPARRCVYCGYQLDVGFVTWLEQGHYDYTCAACSLAGPQRREYV